MRHADVTFDLCARLHWTAPPDRQSAALAAWHAALTGTPPTAQPEPLCSLREVARATHYSPAHLWRLGVQACDEGFGGRPRYRLGRVLEYLRGPECAARREALRAARRTEGGAR